MKPLLFAHVGDLHLTTANSQNFKDFCSIAAQIELHCPLLDFIYLPGDNADHGRPEEYQLARTVLRMFSKPVHCISGDHDMEQGNLSNMQQHLSSVVLPYEEQYRHYSCIFLDCCGPGSGGPDFNLGQEQLDWLKEQLMRAKENGHIAILFMHTYPADLVREKERVLLLRLLRDYKVPLFAMGHTHFNELSNDGVTVFSATRSTGQIDEGPVGYSLVAVDGDNVSWRFKALEDPFPFALITHPVDVRLARATDGPGIVPLVRPLRAVIFSDLQIRNVCFQVDAGSWEKMQFVEEEACWQSAMPVSIPAGSSLTVRVIDERGRPGFHQVRPADNGSKKHAPFANGSDADRIAYWPENGIPGSQLGPNRNSKPFPKPKKV